MMTLAIGVLAGFAVKVRCAVPHMGCQQLILKRLLRDDAADRAMSKMGVYGLLRIALQFLDIKLRRFGRLC